MTLGAKKTINSVLLIIVSVLVSVLIGNISLSRQDMRDLTKSNNELTTKLAERIIISDNAIAANNEDHCTFNLNFVDHTKRISCLENDNSVIKSKLDNTRVTRFKKD